MLSITCAKAGKTGFESSGTTRPTRPAERVRSFSGRSYPSTSRAASTAWRAWVDTPCLPFRTLDTVAVLTPACSARSVRRVRTWGSVGDTGPPRPRWLPDCTLHPVKALRESYRNELQGRVQAGYVRRHQSHSRRRSRGRLHPPIAWRTQMRRSITLAAALGLTLSLAACSGSPADKPTTAAPKDTSTLTIWVDDT